MRKYNITPEEATEAVKKYGSERKASKVLKIPRSTFKRILRKTNQPKEEITTDYKKDSATLTCNSLNIRSLDDVLRFSNVDLDKWEVERHLINSWEMNDKQNYQVKVWLKAKTKSWIYDSLDAVVERIINEKKPETQTKFSMYNKDIMVVPGLVDHHFGMLAWHAETGEGNYDLKIAEKLYINAIEHTINLFKKEEIAKFLFPIGSDFFHINNPKNLTPKGGFHLDVDNRLMKVFETGEYAVIRSIERALEIAPVHIAYVPGNHDPELSFFLCKIIDAYFRNNKNFSIDISPKSRKFYKWGPNLLGLTHGDEEPHKNLPTIMADSCPEWWGKCTNKEWLVGHFHKKKQMDFISVDSFGNTKVRFLPSLCRIDNWHYKKGYITGPLNNKACEVYAYSNDGFHGYFPVYDKNIK